MNDTAANTDRELWREKPGDYYSPHLWVTEGGGIGMDVGGCCIVMPIHKWHALAVQSFLTSEKTPTAPPGAQSSHSEPLPQSDASPPSEPALSGL